MSNNITDEKIKESFPELFSFDMDDPEKQAELTNLREAIRTRLGMDKDFLNEACKKINFSTAEKFLYAAILSLATREDVKRGMLELRVALLEDELEQLKKVNKPSAPAVETVQAKQKVPIQKKINKKK